MIKWFAVIAVILYLASFLYAKRFEPKEFGDERGKLIFYKSRSQAFPFVLAGWAALYFLNQAFHLSYAQFQDAVVLIVVGVNLIQFSYLLTYLPTPALSGRVRLHATGINPAQTHVRSDTYDREHPCRSLMHP